MHDKSEADGTKNMWQWLKRKLGSSSSSSRQPQSCDDTNASSFTILQLLQALVAQTTPHLCQTLFYTGAFLIAWAWDLVAYAVSHVQAGQSPLHNQLSFAVTNDAGHFYSYYHHSLQGQPVSQAFILLMEYILVCVAASVATWYLDTNESLRHHPNHSSWTPAARQAVEFFPSPIFAGKLLVYLAQFQTTLGPLERAMVNWGVTAASAVVAHAAAVSTPVTMPCSVPAPLQHTAHIVCQALGFGLGIAWNVLLWQWIGPTTSSSFSSSSSSLESIFYWVAFTGYLLFVAVLAIRLAVHSHVPVDNDNNNNNDTIWDRQRSLLSFAANVVCAFAAVDYLNALLVRPDWIGNVQALIILLVASGFLSGIVAQQQQQHGSDAARDTTTESSQSCSCSLLPQAVSQNCRAVAVWMMPCTWCTCPWLPLLCLLAPLQRAQYEEWFHVIAVIAGLASSIQASSLLTASVDGLATNVLHICAAEDSDKSCLHPWAFVSLQIIVASCTTLLLLYLLGKLPNSATTTTNSSSTTSTGATSSTTSRSTRRKRSKRRQGSTAKQQQQQQQQGESRPLLQSLRHSSSRLSGDHLNDSNV